MPTIYGPVPPVSIIASNTLGADAATIDFASLPQNYRNLRLTISGRCTDAVVASQVSARFNADSGANYNYETSYSSAGAIVPGLSTAQTNALIGLFPGASTTSTRIGVIDLLVPRYAQGTFVKSYLCSFFDGVQRVGPIGGWWANVAAITQITLIDLTGANFLAGTDAVLYGEL